MKAVIVSVLLSVIVFSLFACGQLDPSVCHGSFYIDHGKFSQKQEADIYRAASRWNAFLGYDYFSIEDGGTCAITVKDGDADKAAYYEWTPTIARKRPFIAIEPSFMKEWGGYEDPTTNDMFQSVMLHEMFHSIGGNHIPDGPAIITAAVSSMDFTQNDMEECANIGMCNR